MVKATGPWGHPLPDNVTCVVPALPVTGDTTKLDLTWKFVVGVNASPVELLSSQILDEVSEQGSAILPGIAFINDRQLTDNAELDALARELNSNTGMNFYLVAHLGGDQDLEQLINRSMIRAQTVRQGLINLGVDGNRLLARAVGPLAPSCIGENCSERVELVLRPVSE